MDSQTKEVRNAYMREWRARNKDKVKVHQENYWKKRANEYEIRKEEILNEKNR